jgi:hypothetical protein
MERMAWSTEGGEETSAEWAVIRGLVGAVSEGVGAFRGERSLTVLRRGCSHIRQPGLSLPAALKCLEPMSVAFFSCGKGDFCSLFKSMIATCPPLARIARQISRPMPLAPPVTTQTFPSRENESSVRLVRALLECNF